MKNLLNTIILSLVVLLDIYVTLNLLMYGVQPTNYEMLVIISTTLIAYSSEKQK